MFSSLSGTSRVENGFNKIKSIQLSSFCVIWTPDNVKVKALTVLVYYSNYPIVTQGVPQGNYSRPLLFRIIPNFSFLNTKKVNPAPTIKHRSMYVLDNVSGCFHN